MTNPHTLTDPLAGLTRQPVGEAPVFTPDIAPLSPRQRVEIYRWMILTRIFDERMLAYWKQGLGVGGTYSQRGHEAISVAAGYALGPDDIVAPMHRDLGCYLLRGLTPRRIFAQLLGKADGVSQGRDANLHGLGDLSLGIIGFISHLPLSMPVTAGVAMSFKLRQEPRVALTFIGDGSASAGVWHETMNLAATFQLPAIFIIQNNQYAYSTPVSEQTREIDIAKRAMGYGMTAEMVDGNDADLVYAAVKEAVERARQGGGPTLIEAKTMRMLGHAIHDGAEYVPADLLAGWEALDPVRRYHDRLLAEGVASQEELDALRRQAVDEVEEAITFAEASPLPSPEEVTVGVYSG
jgi:pyruvate dehydrogenase E1 component alpha subunit